MSLICVKNPIIDKKKIKVVIGKQAKNKRNALYYIFF